jgi:glycolate oxidase
MPSTDLTDLFKEHLGERLSESADIVTDPAIIEGYRRDQAAPRLLAAGMPAAVVRPRSTADVQATIRTAGEYGVPIVPRGAGSGLSGGANAIDGCVVISLERMTDIMSIDKDSMTATAQAGVVTGVLGEAASAQKLWYAPDPASVDFCTLGGNVATNAGGLCCVKYGVTRDALLEVEVVLADGRALRFGRRTRKGVAGYDLASLFCGSEGTLGVITEATVRLLPPSTGACTLVASFEDLPAAGRASLRITQGCRPALLELMDRTTVQAVERYKPMDLGVEVAALLFARSDSGVLQSKEEIGRMAAICEAEGATLVVTSDDEAEGRMLMAARKLAFPALEQLGTTLLDDVAVPLGAVPKLLAAIEAIAEKNEVLIGTFGHAGDGNMHPTIVYDHDDDDAIVRVRRAFQALVRTALDLHGTVSGEHGIGLLKSEFLVDELKGTLAVNETVKRALDPDGLMNPGKMISIEEFPPSPPPPGAELP